MGSIVHASFHRARLISQHLLTTVVHKAVSSSIRGDICRQILSTPTSLPRRRLQRVHTWLACEVLRHEEWRQDAGSLISRRGNQSTISSPRYQHLLSLCIWQATRRMDCGNNGSNAGVCPPGLKCKRCKVNIGQKRHPSVVDEMLSLGSGDTEVLQPSRAPMKHVRRNEENGQAWTQQAMGIHEQNAIPVQNGFMFNGGLFWHPNEVEKIQNSEGLQYQNSLQEGLQHYGSQRINSSEVGKAWKVVGDSLGLVHLDSPVGRESPSPGVLSHLQDIEAQVNWLRGENSELKKALSNLSHITNSEASNTNSKSKEFYEKIVGKINSLHSCLRIVEAKVDFIRSSKENSLAAIIGLKDKEDPEARNKKKFRLTEIL